MKTILVALSLLAAAPAFGQVKATYQGPEIAAPVKGVGSLVVHSADSAKAAYLAAVRGLLAAGYGLDRQEAAVGFVSSTPKLLPTGSGVRLVVQISVAPGAAGSDVTYRGIFTWASIIAAGTTYENQQLPAVYVGSGPVRRAWDGVEQVAKSSFPSARIGYK